jgi:hypothetical protein
MGTESNALRPRTRPINALPGDLEAARDILEQASAETSSPEDLGRLVPLIRDQDRADILASVGTTSSHATSVFLWSTTALALS